MATAINFVLGDAPSRPARIITATADLTAVTSYATGGVADAILQAELAKMGTSYSSMPMAAHDGSATRWFKVNPANGKLVAYTTASLETEVSAAVDLSGYTAVPVLVFGE